MYLHFWFLPLLLLLLDLRLSRSKFILLICLLRSCWLAAKVSFDLVILLEPPQINYKRNQTARNNFWNWKNLAFVKNQNGQNWKVLHVGTENLSTLQFWGRENLSNPQLWHTIRATSKLLWTQRTLSRQHLYNNLAIRTCTVQNWRFSVNCQLLLNVLSC